MSVRIESHRDEVERAINQALERALDGVGIIVEREAKDELENDPRRIDTGNLRNSITHDVVESEQAVYVGTNVEYGIYVHEGTGQFAADGNGRKEPWVYQDDNGKWHVTKGMKPNRFLKNAVERNTDQIKEYIEDALKNG